MHASEFQFIAGLLKKRSGLTLGDDKAYLIESRLLPIARALKLADISALCEKLRANASEDLLVEITEAMTTNESSFFRDIKPYEQLRQFVLPQLMQSLAPKKHLRIWSAACSTGQEPYSIAMSLLEDGAKMPGWNFDIVATDLASKVLARAKEGIYSQFEIQRGLPIQLLVKYFLAMPDTSWQIKENIRAMIKFNLLNLLDDYTNMGKFELIFCRNVLIYFDDAIRSKITEKMAHSLSPLGILILGSTESIVDPQGLFTPVEELRGAYRLKAPL